MARPPKTTKTPKAIASIDAQGRIVAQALARLGALLATDAPVGPNA